MTEEFEITRQTNIAQLTNKYPETAEVLLSYGLHCVGCMASAFDTIEVGAKIHGMSDEEIDELITRVREVAKYGK